MVHEQEVPQELYRRGPNMYPEGVVVLKVRMEDVVGPIYAACFLYRIPWQSSKFVEIFHFEPICQKLN